jgi:hypothetical protein
MRKIPKVQISGKCKPRSKKIVADSKYTFGDAVDFFAMTINNPRKRLELEIKVVKTEIDDLKLDLLSKEVYLEKLEDQLIYLDSLNCENREDVVDPEVKKAISYIIRIANRIGCNPLDVNKFTGKDTLGFHADNCGVSKFELIDLISSEVAGGE